MSQWTSDQIANASVILSVGNNVGANAKQLLASIEAALTESNLKNLNYGDRDSLGLFQQRTSMGWGTTAQIRDPYYAARAFFLGAGSNKGALTVAQGGTAGQLAQRVQRSAFPSRYDQHETDARDIMAQFAVSAPTVFNSDDPLASNDEGDSSAYLDSNAPGATGAIPVVLLIGGGLLALYFILK